MNQNISLSGVSPIDSKIVYNNISGSFFLFSADENGCVVFQSDDIKSFSNGYKLSFEFENCSLSYAAFNGGKFFFIAKKLSANETKIKVFSSADLISFEEIKPVFPLRLENEIRGESLYFDESGRMWLFFCLKGKAFVAPFFDNGPLTAVFPLFSGKTNLTLGDVGFASLFRTDSGELHILYEERTGAPAVYDIKSQSGSLLGPWVKNGAAVLKIGGGNISMVKGKKLMLISKENAQSRSAVFELLEHSGSLRILNETGESPESLRHEKYSSDFLKAKPTDIRKVFESLDMKEPVNRAAVAKQRRALGGLT